MSQRLYLYFSVSKVQLKFFKMIYISDFLLEFTLGYIDPGTGSVIIQAIIAAVVGIGLSLKLFWHRILTFLGIRKTLGEDRNISSEKKD